LPLTRFFKHSDKGEDDKLLYGVSAMQGWRISMEDAHTTVLDMKPASGSSIDVPLSFFGVYDGHGGDKVALFSGDNLHNIILEQESFKAGKFAQGLKDGFLATDRAILDGMHNHLLSICSPRPAQSYPMRARPSRSHSDLQSLIPL
jgi:serine/threonine protein phosphatase PrpC